MHKFYVYTHTRKDTNQVFYVGKGKIRSGANPYHRSSSRRSRNSEWYKIVSMTAFSVQIVHTTDDEEEAFSEERKLVSRYGRTCNGTGILCNIGTGGGGGVSIPHPSEWSRSRFKPCYRYTLDGEFIDEFPSYSIAARTLSINYCNLKKCLRGKIRFTGGYQWRTQKYNNIGRYDCKKDMLQV